MELVQNPSENGRVLQDSQSQNVTEQRTSSRKPSGKIPTLATAWFTKVTDRQRKNKTSTKQRATDGLVRVDTVEDALEPVQVPPASPAPRILISAEAQSLALTSQDAAPTLPDAANKAVIPPHDLALNGDQVAQKQSDESSALVKQDDSAPTQALQPSNQSEGSSSGLLSDSAPDVESNGGKLSLAVPAFQKQPAPTMMASHSTLGAIEESSESLTDYAKRAELAKSRIWTWLQHYMRGFERVQAAISVESTHPDRRILITVTCSGRAITKRKEIESILSQRSMRSELRDFRVEVKDATEGSGFWFMGLSMMTGSDVTVYGNSHIDVTNIYAKQDSLQFNWEKGVNASVPFAVSPYWTTGAALVECSVSRRPRSDEEALFGTLIRTQTKSTGSVPGEIFWTYGGTIKVDEQLYGFTTAHPLVYSHANDHDDLPKGEGKRPAKNDVPEGVIDGLYDEWQPLGLVSKYALADFGAVPAGNDWLLIDLISKTIPPPGQTYIRKGLVVQTHLGTVAGILLPGSSFIILGTSSFEAAKLDLARPLMNGDSGAFVVRDGDLFGVVIAGGKDPAGRPFAYVLKAQDVCKSVSDGMNGAAVRFPTSSENAILAHKTLYPDSRFITLASLYVDHLFNDTRVCAHIDIAAPPLQNSYGLQDHLVEALLALGAGHASAPTRRVPTLSALQSKRHRLVAMIRSFAGRSPSTSSWKRLAVSQPGIEAAAVVMTLLYWFEPSMAVDILLEVFRELQVHIIPSRKIVSNAVYDMSSILSGNSIEKVRRIAGRERPGFVFTCKALARIIYAAQISAFYVYTGPWAMWLYKLARLWLGYNGVYKVASAEAERAKFEHAIADMPIESDGNPVPFIFVRSAVSVADSVPPGGPTEDYGATPYGDIIDCPELKSVLSRIWDDPSSMIESEAAGPVDDRRLWSASDLEDPELTRRELRTWARQRSHDMLPMLV
ncbi:hypothetical protein B0A48_08678 [Cryoendolithus antarcticus]|uniref:Uncharacterized protein n=1 Tax=Cryoendolithus antarcticus TaxID=1507870 RepID=A0A1V8T422_9PEZI|nr:hypothetical protein B0A48_08678 [Cryoendolithus antarcticus]